MSKRVVPQETPILPPDAPDASLDQVRNILFGQQVREFDARLKGMETEFQQSSQTMQSDLLDRIARLEKEFSARLEQEADERQISHSALQGNLDKAVDDLDSRLVSEAKELRHDLKDQGKELNKKIEALAAQMQAAMDELRLQKTDRMALADLLGGVAERLRKG